MKKITLILFLLLFSSSISLAQSKEKVEAAFLQQLNTTLTNSKEYAWNDFMQEVTSVKIAKPFTIINGFLNMTLTYKVADSTTIIRMSAPVNKIKSVVYDHYLVLQFDDDEVEKEQFLPNDNVVAATTAQNYLHIGTPVKNGRKELVKLEKLLEHLLHCYK